MNPYAEILARMNQVSKQERGRVLDAAESIFVTRQLNQVLAQVLEVQYPEVKGRKYVPKLEGIAEGAETFTQTVYDEVGMAKIIASEADDLPNLNVKGKEITGKIHNLGGWYGWNIFEMLRASFAGVPLDSLKGKIARRVMLRAEDSLIAIGGIPATGQDSAITGLTGFLNNTNVSSFTFSNTPWDATGVTGPEILADLNGWANSIMLASKGIFSGKRLLLPIYWFLFLSAFVYDTTGQNPKSVLAVFLENSPVIKEIDSWYLLDTADEGDPLGVIYDPTPEVAACVVPMEFRQLPPWTNGFVTQVICISRCGGTVIRQPLGIVYGSLPKDDPGP